MKKKKALLEASKIEELTNVLESGKRILILPHANPDGDAIGSGLGLYNALIEQNIKVDIACADPVPEEFRYLKNSDHIKTDFKSKNYEIIIFVDCGNKKMVRFQEEKPEIHTEQFFKVNIDHHPSNDDFGDLNFVITHLASASMIVFKILQALNYKITPTTASCLLLGIYTDTGGFMHQNTNSDTYNYAAELIKLGASQSPIAKNIFHTYDFATLKLWGKVLKNLHVTKDRAAIVGVEEEDYLDLNCKREDLGGVIDYINSMPEADYSVLLSEDGKGNVKASLRTRSDEVDVKEIAEQYGGGGHVKAAGFSIKGGHLEKEVKWKIIQEK